MRNGPRSRGNTLALEPVLTGSESGQVAGPSLRGIGNQVVEPVTSDSTKMSPTTPRAPTFPDTLPTPLQLDQGGNSGIVREEATHGPLRVTVSMEPIDDEEEVKTGEDKERMSVSSPTPRRGRGAPKSIPSSPTGYNGDAGVKQKGRTLSVDGRDRDGGANEGVSVRERRQSQVSAHSASSASGARKPSIRDYILGEELGQGSYSTVSDGFSISSNKTLVD
jgi:3-phosphoinositide dependent protein kinase-1